MPVSVAARARRRPARTLTIEILPSQNFPKRFCIVLSGFHYRSLEDVPLARARALASELLDDFKRLGERPRLVDRSAAPRPLA